MAVNRLHRRGGGEDTQQGGPVESLGLIIWG